MDKNFADDINKLYAQLYGLGQRARQIITGFVKSHGGSYTFDTDNDDPIWIDGEAYATTLKVDSDGCVLVYNSAQYSKRLDRMEAYDVIDIAYRLNNMK